MALYGWRGVRVVGVVGIASLLGGRPLEVVLAIVGLCLAVVAPYALLAWMRFTYRVDGDALEVRSGVLVRSIRSIPLDRVRGVDVSAPLLHRVAGLVRVRVEDATGGERDSGLTLAAISRADSRRLRDAVLRGGRDGATSEPEEPEIRMRVGLGTLALAGATSPRHLLVPLAAVGAVMNIAGGDRLPFARDIVDSGLEIVPTDVLGIALVAVAAILLAVAVAAAGSLLVDGGFTLSGTPERLVAERGLLARRSVSIPRRRVRALEVRDSPPWRAVGLADLRAIVGGVPSQGEARGRTTLLPAGRSREVWDLAARIDPLVHDGLDPHPARGRRRRLTRACILPALAAVVAGGLGEWIVAAAATVVAAGMVAVALDRHRSLGNRLRGGRLGLRDGSLWRRHSVIDPDGIVAYRVSQSPGQRWAGLCTLTVFLGEGAGSRRALDVDPRDASALLRRLDPRLMSPLLAPPASGGSLPRA